MPAHSGSFVLSVSTAQPAGLQFIGRISSKSAQVQTPGILPKWEESTRQRLSGQAVFGRDGRESAGIPRHLKSGHAVSQPIFTAELAHRSASGFQNCPKERRFGDQLDEIPQNSGRRHCGVLVVWEGCTRGRDVTGRRSGRFAERHNISEFMD